MKNTSFFNTIVADMFGIIQHVGNDVMVFRLIEKKRQTLITQISLMKSIDTDECDVTNQILKFRYYNYVIQHVGNDVKVFRLIGETKS